MTLKQIKKLNYADLLYLQLIVNTEFYKKEPFKAYAVFPDTFGGIGKMVVFFASNSGNISTRSLCLNQKDLAIIIERFETDYGIEVECHEYETD